MTSPDFTRTKDFSNIACSISQYVEKLPYITIISNGAS